MLFIVLFCTVPVFVCDNNIGSWIAVFTISKCLAHVLRGQKESFVVSSTVFRVHVFTTRGTTVLEMLGKARVMAKKSRNL